MDEQEGKPVALRREEYLLYRAGTRRGHAEGLRAEAKNARALVKRIRAAGTTGLAEALEEHSKTADNFADAARADADALLSEGLELRGQQIPAWDRWWTRIRLAWRTALGA